MSLTVLSIAYPLAPVGPDAVGGAEQVLHTIDEALINRAPRSLVIACEGSRAHGELIQVPLPEGPFDEATRALAQDRMRRAVSQAVETHHPDVVHLHGLDFRRYLPPDGPAAVATLHLPPDWYEPGALASAGERVHLVCVSRSQRARLPPGLTAEVIQNGVPLGAWRFEPTRSDHVLALGRICPEKGFHLAIEAARRAGMPLLLAGTVFPYEEHQRYFDEVLRPMLDGERRFIGAVGLEQKRELLGGARCLVVPSLCEETSSLVAMEALACGTPVVARRVGALPEIIEHGRTGFLVQSTEELAEAIRASADLRPEDCRAAAERHFSSERMTNDYLDLYERLANSRGRQSRPSPRARLEVVEFEPGSLEGLRGEWSDLWDRCPRATPFEHPDWLLAWAKRFRPRDPWVLAARRAGKLTAIAPLLRYEDRGRRVLGLMGGGISDYGDLLVEPGEDASLAALLDAIVERGDDWDACEIEPLAAGSPLLAAAAPPGWVAETSDGGCCPVVELPAEVERLGEVIPTKLLANLRNARRRAGRAGRFEADPVTPDNLGELLGALMRLHRARWTERGEPGVLDEGLLGFHQEVAARFLARGQLLTVAIRIDRQIVSVVHAFLAHGRASLYLGGFAPEFAHLSPGTLAIGEVLEQAVRRKVREFDFLRGREPYKYAWGAEDRPIHRWRLRRSAPEELRS